MEGPLSPGATNGVSTTNPFPAVDPTLVVGYLTDLLQITLGATRKDLEARGSLLSKARHADTVQRCTRFASESQVALYVQKDVLVLEEVNGGESSPGTTSPM